MGSASGATEVPVITITSKHESLGTAQVVYRAGKAVVEQRYWEDWCARVHNDETQAYSYIAGHDLTAHDVMRTLNAFDDLSDHQVVMRGWTPHKKGFFTPKHRGACLENAVPPIIAIAHGNVEAHRRGVKYTASLPRSKSLLDELTPLYPEHNPDASNKEMRIEFVDTGAIHAALHPNALDFHRRPDGRFVCVEAFSTILSDAGRPDSACQGFGFHASSLIK